MPVERRRGRRAGRRRAAAEGALLHHGADVREAGAEVGDERGRRRVQPVPEHGPGGGAQRVDGVGRLRRRRGAGEVPGAGGQRLELASRGEPGQRLVVADRGEDRAAQGGRLAGQLVGGELRQALQRRAGEQLEDPRARDGGALDARGVRHRAGTPSGTVHVR